MENNSLNSNNFIFTYIVLGIKEVPFNTEVLLVNNIPDNTLDIIYSLDGNNKTIKVPKDKINNISAKPSMQMQNVAKKVTTTETRSMLLSTVMFGGSPLLQLAGAGALEGLFDSLSNNYDKVDYKASYEITIEASQDNGELKLMLNSDIDPTEFINNLKTN